MFIRLPNFRVAYIAVRLQLISALIPNPFRFGGLPCIQFVWNSRIIFPLNVNTNALFWIREYKALFWIMPLFNS